MKATFRRTVPVLALLVPVVFAGCGTQDTILGPTSGLGSDNAVVGTTVAATDMSDGTWKVVASQKVQPGQQESVVQGSRYTLTFSKGAVHNATTITIMEHDPDVIDVQLSPDGSKFDAPVTLTVDYAGTSNDPASPWYHGHKLNMMRFNDSMGTWDALNGVDDPVARTYTVTLTGFSRYAMGGSYGRPTDGYMKRHQPPTAEIETP